MGSPRPAVTVVVPTYNERDNIAALARRLFDAVDPQTTELLVVDDDSPDGTAEVCDTLAREGLPVRCIVRRGERGLATAVLRGMAEARGNLIVVMDADLSHPPESVPALLAALRDPAVRMAIGSRFAPGGSLDRRWPWKRRLNSWGARLLARPLTRVRDMMSGFFCVRRADLRLEELRPVGYKIALELIVRHGWKRVVEVPIAFAERAAGQTKLDLAEQARYLRHLGRLYAHALNGWAGLLLIAALYAAGMSAYVAVRAERGTDFRDYWENASHFLQTGEISTTLGVHNYLPFFTIFMAPWGLLPLRAAIVLFTLLSVAALCATALIGDRLIGGGGRRPRAATVAALLLALPYVHSCLTLGAVELLVLFLIVAGWFLIERGRDAAAGALIGVAALIKVLPGALVVLLLLRRRWLAAGCAAATMLALGWGLPLLRLGHAETLRQHREFVRGAVVEHSARTTILSEKPRKAKYTNNALPIVLRRVLTAINSDPSDAEPQRSLFVNIADLPREAVWYVYLATALVILVGTLAATTLPGGRGPPDGAAMLATFGLWCAAMVLLSPLVWTRYLLLAYPALLVLADRLERARGGGAVERDARAAWWSVVVWLLGIVLLAWPVARAFGAQLAALASVWVALLVILLRPERARPRP